MNKNLRIADHHCHISKQYFENPLQEIKNLQADSGLEYVCVMGVDYDNDKENIVYKREFNNEFIRIGVGLHPSEIIELGKSSKHEFERIKLVILENVELVDYIGEIGIDFTYPDAEKYKSEQIEIFEQFCILGRELSKPVSIHARGAMKEVMEVVEKVFDGSKFNGFLHCFTGNMDEARFFVKHGLKLGIGGIITFKKSEELRSVIKTIINENPDKSLDDLLGLETDTPYLSPEPIRSQPNNPRNIKIIADYITHNLIEA